MAFAKCRGCGSVLPFNAVRGGSLRGVRCAACGGAVRRLTADEYLDMLKAKLAAWNLICGTQERG